MTRVANDTVDFSEGVSPSVLGLPATLYAISVKRLFDLVFAILILPVVGAVIAVLWLVVRADGGSGFFGHHRVGQDGKIFRCWKLRTMRHNADDCLAAHLAADADARAEWQRDHKLRDDPRVTRLGTFLRKTSLDELPQLWNVLTGDMSFVGPRPVVQDELRRYGPHSEAYLKGRPGITGLWQVSGRNDLTYGERVQLDVEYRQTMSFLRDTSILFLTIGTVLRGTGH